MPDRQPDKGYKRVAAAPAVTVSCGTCDRVDVFCCCSSLPIVGIAVVVVVVVSCTQSLLSSMHACVSACVCSLAEHDVRILVNGLCVNVCNRQHKYDRQSA